MHEENHKADRDVDPEDPRPRQALGDPTPDNRAGNESKPGHAAEHAERLAALLRRKGCTQQRHRRGHHQRRAGALDSARGDQRAGAVGQRAGGRRRDEQGEARSEHAAAAEAVAEGGAGQ